jgi:hypothetical protein
MAGAYDTGPPLYKRYNIELDPAFLNVDKLPEGTYELDAINQHSNDIECLLAQQHALLWNEDKYLEISPGQNSQSQSCITTDGLQPISSSWRRAP